MIHDDHFCVLPLTMKNEDVLSSTSTHHLTHLLYFDSWQLRQHLRSTVLSPLLRLFPSRLLPSCHGLSKLLLALRLLGSGEDKFKNRSAIKKYSVWELVPSSGEIGDCNQLNRRIYNGHETHEKCESTLLESVFHLSELGYFRKMVVQCGPEEKAYYKRKHHNFY